MVLIIHGFLLILQRQMKKNALYINDIALRDWSHLVALATSGRTFL
jgi:hypothetical protein